MDWILLIFQFTNSTVCVPGPLNFTKFLQTNTLKQMNNIMVKGSTIWGYGPKYKIATRVIQDFNTFNYYAPVPIAVPL